ncbi:MAG: hypothetical protein ABI365_08520 [Lysobacteraceae bacterium]
MSRIVRAACVVSLLCLASTAMAADPAREAAGWTKWADFTSKVVETGKAEPFNPTGVIAACDGATGVVIGQGFQFPYWAQNIMMACRAYDSFKSFDQKRDAGIDTGSKDEFFSGNMRAIMKRQKKILCRNTASASKELAKATSVESEPRAQPLALELKAQMDNIMVKAECN